MQLYLQELCSHVTLGPTQHPKYTAPPAAAGAGLPAAAAPAPSGPVVQMQLRLRPAVAARQQQGGLLAQLGGGKGVGPADAAPAAWVECSLEVNVCPALLAWLLCLHPLASEGASLRCYRSLACTFHTFFLPS